MYEAGSVSGSSLRSVEVASSGVGTRGPVIWINPTVSAGLYVACLTLQLCIAVHFYTSHDDVLRWWGVTLLCVTLVPTITCNVTSAVLVYLNMDFSDKLVGRLVFYGLHAALLGPIWRQSKILITRDLKDVHELHNICLFQAAFCFGPFLTLITYWMLVTVSYNALQLSAVLITLIFIVLTFSNHTDNMNFTNKTHHHFHHHPHHQISHQTVLPRKYAILSPLLRFSWRLCVLSSRIMSIVMFIAFARYWILLFIFAHWLLMVTGSFLSSKLKPADPHYQNSHHSKGYYRHLQRYGRQFLQIYDVVCFPRHCRLLNLVVFYVLMLIENVIMAVTWFLSDVSQRAGDYRVLLIVSVFLAFLLGFLFMLLNETICYNNRQLCTPEISSHVCCVNSRTKQNGINHSIRDGLVWDSSNELSSSGIIKPYVNKSYVDDVKTENINAVCENEVQYDPGDPRIFNLQGHDDLDNSYLRTAQNQMVFQHLNTKSHPVELDVLSTAELIVQDLSLDLNFSHDSRSCSKATDRSSNTGGASSNSRNTNTLDISFQGEDSNTTSPVDRYRQRSDLYSKQKSSNWCYSDTDKHSINTDSRTGDSMYESSKSTQIKQKQYSKQHIEDRNHITNQNHGHKSTHEDYVEVYGSLRSRSYNSYSVNPFQTSSFHVLHSEDRNKVRGYHRFKNTNHSVSSDTTDVLKNDKNKTHIPKNANNIPNQSSNMCQITAPSINGAGVPSCSPSWSSLPSSASISQTWERERSRSRDSASFSWRQTYTTDYSSESTSYYHDDDYTMTCDSGDTSYFADSDSEFAMTWPPSNRLTRYNITNLPKANMSAQEHVKNWLAQIHLSIQPSDGQTKTDTSKRITNSTTQHGCPRRFSMQNLEVKEFLHKVKPRTALKEYLSRLCTVGNSGKKLAAQSVDNFGYFGTKYLHSKNSQTHMLVTTNKRKHCEGLESLV